jgi:VWFA-related protein
MHVVRILLVVCVAAVLAFGQDGESRPRRVIPPGQSGDAIELRSDLVTLTVSVVDAAGRPIGGLTPPSFRLFEDGRQQTIEYFEPIGDPYSLMLVLDTSGSAGDEVDKMRKASADFVAGVGPEDRLGVIAFSRSIEMLGGMTNDRTELARHLAEVKPTVARDPRASRFDETTGTSFYDAIYLACAESPLAEVKGSGRKAIVVFSDCVDSTSSYRFDQITDAVERSGASVYVLLFDTKSFSDRLLTSAPGNTSRINFSASQLERFYDTHAPDSEDRSREPSSYSDLERLEINAALYDIARAQAEQLATRTGGRVYPVRGLGDLGKAYAAIAAELRTRYSIGYYPSNTKHDGTWRKLKVELPGQPKAQIVTRPGYWAPKP